MSQARIVVLRAPGINCDEETVHAWRLTGGRCDLLHLDRLIESRSRLDQYDIVTIPGGFSYGDDLAAGRIFAVKLRRVADELREFVDRGGLVLGICNGFQVLVQTGLLNARGDHPAALAPNSGGRFENRWVSVAATTDRCVFLERGRTYFLPIAHAEGRFAAGAGVTPDPQLVALRYMDGPRRVGPVNPNGSLLDVAALTDATGRILGMMPHPERYVDQVQHPLHTAAALEREPDGLMIFRAAAGLFE